RGASSRAAGGLADREVAADELELRDRAVERVAERAVVDEEVAGRAPELERAARGVDDVADLERATGEGLAVDEHLAHDDPRVQLLRVRGRRQGRERRSRRRGGRR